MAYVKSGSMTLVPNGSANGVAIGRHDDCDEVIFYLAAGESITYHIGRGEAPSAAPAAYTVNGDDNKTWQEIVPADVSVYITAKTGSPKFRWLKSNI